MRWPWFRMYSEARTDRKLDLLTDEEFRIWFNLLCMASESEERGTLIYDDIDELAIEVAKGDTDRLRHALSRLVTLKMCDVTPQRVTFCNFEKRQQRKPSDTPERTRERKRRSRLASRPVTPMSRPVTPVTPVEEDKDKEKKERPSDVYTPGFLAFWSLWPKKGDSKFDTFKSWRNLRKDHQEAAMAALPKWLPYYESIENRHIPNGTTWLNQRRWEVDPPPVDRRSPNGVHRNGKDNPFWDKLDQMRKQGPTVIETKGTVQ